MGKLRVLCVLSLLITTQVSGQALWEENFADEATGAVTGIAGGPLGGNWASIDPGAGNLAKNELLGFSYFEASNTGGEAVWYTDPISVVGVTGYIVINLTIGSFSVEPDDYVRCYYRVDGVLKYYSTNKWVATKRQSWHLTTRLVPS